MRAVQLKAQERDLIRQLLANEKYRWLNERIRQQYAETVDGDLLAARSTLPPAARSSSDTREILVVTLVSREYLNLGRNWLRRIRDAGVRNLYMVCADRESHEYFCHQNVFTTIVDTEDAARSTAEKNFSGFSAKGLLLADLRYLACNEGMAKGYDVVFSDLDAIWMKNALPHLRSLDADFAFQSVKGFPPELVRLWGFAACSGFFYLGATETASLLCHRMVALLKDVASDQLVMNAALSEMDIDWELPAEFHALGSAKIEKPYPAMTMAVVGHGRSYPCRIVALPQNLYRRHMWMPVPVSDALVLHPNSPKEETPKLEIFRQLGVEMN